MILYETFTPWDIWLLMMLVCFYTQSNLELFIIHKCSNKNITETPQDAIVLDFPTHDTANNSMTVATLCYTVHVKNHHMLLNCSCDPGFTAKNVDVYTRIRQQENSISAPCAFRTKWTFWKVSVGKESWKWHADTCTRHTHTQYWTLTFLQHCVRVSNVPKWDIWENCRF